ncbi:GNAT family N-acetyltransferase [Apirhabdus apintestini]|uniref:GNAT family N-acetyltransferase n=1 Tax=Erwinia sp. HR93 TaxID=3094840 RepID=UPI002ADEBED7|nr:GNAT family N-acetyltransferase [Erwinia sp. HR93]MEA1063065.1 GNAT family N-acetyltransferase [Erwinia sp. HR93]WPM84920.1 GNAT family N-acetyltransferase [Enterobacteriaceae bacterium CA-0114]
MPHITLRHAAPEDAEALLRINAHPDVLRNTLQFPYPAPDTWLTRLTQKQAGQHHLVACIDTNVAGHLHLQVEQNPRRSHVASFGISVDPHWQGQGVASTLLQSAIDLCDNWLRVERLELSVYVDNAPALALYQKYDFAIEGTGRQYALRNGEYTDVYFMARLKNEHRTAE